MNPYQFEVTCDICGGTGMGTIRTSAAAWDRNRRVVHQDPDICRYYLDKQKKELDKARTIIEKVER